jgi:hypothetical protein
MEPSYATLVWRPDPFVETCIVVGALTCEGGESTLLVPLWDDALWCRDALTPRMRACLDLVRQSWLARTYDDRYTWRDRAWHGLMPQGMGPQFRMGEWRRVPATEKFPTIADWVRKIVFRWPGAQEQLQ